MLLNPNAVITAMETLTAEDFYSAAHRAIFEAMAQLYAASQPVDVITVLGALEQQGKAETAGGMEYLAGLSRTVPVSANAGHYVSIVEERAVLRGVIKAGSEMVDVAFEAQKPADEVVSEAHDAVYGLAVRKRKDSLRHIREALLTSFDRINEAAASSGGLTGTPSGFSDLDDMTTGFAEGQLIVLAARPGKGKTSFALNIAHNIAVKKNMPVAMFSLEMSAEDLALRLMCADAEVRMSAARTGRLSDEEMARLTHSLGELGKAPLYVDASGSATVPEIRARCMRLSAQNKLGLVIIDYLQLMSSASRIDSRQQEVSELTRSMKMMARDLGAPVMVLSQLNREIERRKEKRPMLADLRESGSIEQDADVVIFLAHESDLAEDEEFAEDAVQNGARAIIAKNRNGPVGEAPLFWLSEYTKFVSASQREE